MTNNVKQIELKPYQIEEIDTPYGIVNFLKKMGFIITTTKIDILLLTLLVVYESYLTKNMG